MTMDIAETKRVWRRLATDMFRLVNREDRRELDGVLSERLREVVFSRQASFLLGYAPMLDEPDLAPFFRNWLADGGRLAMPVWLGGTGMVLREVTDLDRQMRPGRGGILEPAETQPEVAAAQLDLVIAPGRLFSEQRQRLGRGSGCYDVLLSGGGLVSVGVAYDFQVFPILPVVDTDATLDILITPTRLLMKPVR